MPYALNPDRNEPWNGLPLLPIEESYYKSLDIYERLVDARAALAQLQGRSIAIPDQGMLINTISLQEAKASSAIENIFTTDDELYRAFSEQNNENTNGAPKEILRYREALWEGHQYLKKNGAFDRNYFVSLYQQVKQTSDGIRPPVARVSIKQGGSGLTAGQTVYTPPRGEGIIEEKLDNLIAFLNEKRSAVDPLIKMAIAHAQFEAIHPFRDGNGRAGRICNINYITHAGLLERPILFMSRYIILNKDEYYHRLAGITQRGDWKEWILYMLEAVQQTAILTYVKINSILESISAVEEALHKTDIQRPEQLTKAIFTQPFTRVKHLTDSGIYAENTARKYLNKLVEMQILELKVIQGNHYYLNLELNRILAE